MQKVTEHFPNAKLVMIGDGALLKQAQKLTKELRLEKNVEFRGSRSPAEVSDALKDALAFVQHSLTAEDGDKEGTPNTILEASSSALPVISTAHAGIKEAVIHGETGYLVDEGDWEGMADYMIKLANNHELATEMGKNGREHIIRNYNIKNQIEVFHKAFAEAVKKQK